MVLAWLILGVWPPKFTLLSFLLQRNIKINRKNRRKTITLKKEFYYMKNCYNCTVFCLFYLIIPIYLSTLINTLLYTFSFHGASYKILDRIHFFFLKNIALLVFLVFFFFTYMWKCVIFLKSIIFIKILRYHYI